MSTDIGNSMADLRRLATAEAIAWENFTDSIPEDAGNTPLGYWRLSEDYMATLDDLLEGYRSDLLPVAVHAVERLIAEYQRLKTEDAGPGTDFLAARRDVYDAIMQITPEPQLPESVADLVKQGVKDYQIARIWKLYLENGNEDLDAVQMEKAHPGSIITEEYKQQLRDRLSAQIRGVPAKQVVYRRVEPKPDRPSIEQMIRDRANVEQIVRAKCAEYGLDEHGQDHMLNVVRVLAKEIMGVELPGSATAQLRQEGAEQLARKHGDALAKTVEAHSGQPAYTGEIELRTPGPDDEPAEVAEVEQPIDVQVAELFAAGHDIGSIAQHLQIDAARVQQIIEAWQKTTG